jgi:hypothetical protein
LAQIIALHLVAFALPIFHASILLWFSDLGWLGLCRGLLARW